MSPRTILVPRKYTFALQRTFEDEDGTLIFRLGVTSDLELPRLSELQVQSLYSLVRSRTVLELARCLVTILLLSKLVHRRSCGRPTYVHDYMSCHISTGRRGPIQFLQRGPLLSVESCTRRGRQRQRRAAAAVD